LIAIDAEATEKLEAAKLSAGQILIDAKKEAANTFNLVLSRAGVRIDKLTKDYERFTKEDIERLKNQLAVDLSNMDDSLKQKRVEIINNMYNAIIA
jgi:F0F1-type ATP synthase membrane subunit b/b'